MNDDIKYMSRALELAKLGAHHAAPNPMVGAVIVENGEIIGQGYHKKCGEAHAEVNAIDSVVERERLERATIYVTLEPCSHFGRTPPCTQKIIANKIPRVVIATIDPFSKVNGNGVRILREAGIEVIVGVLEREAIDLNKRFFTFHREKRPYIILKWAQTCDGYIDQIREKGSTPAWLTGQRCKELVHKLRSEEAAIMVGSNTVIMDNPSLTVREWSGKNPVRVVIDRELKLSGEYKIFNNEAQTLIFNQKNDEGKNILINFANENWLYELLTKLHERNLTSLVVEGGTTLLNFFINNDLYDEALIFISPLSLQELEGSDGVNGVNSPLFPKGKRVINRVIDGVIVKNILKNE